LQRVEEQVIPNPPRTAKNLSLICKAFILKRFSFIVLTGLLT